MPNSLSHAKIKEFFGKEGIEFSYMKEGGNESLRISFDVSNTKEEIDTFFEKLDFLKIYATPQPVMVSFTKRVQNKRYQIGNVAASLLVLITMYGMMHYKTSPSSLTKNEKSFVQELSDKQPEKVAYYRRQFPNKNPRSINLEALYAKPLLLNSLVDTKKTEEIINHRWPSLLNEKEYSPEEMLAIELAAKTNKNLNILVEAFHADGKRYMEITNSLIDKTKDVKPDFQINS